MGAWGRLALIQAAGESKEILERIAQQWGYQKRPEKKLELDEKTRFNHNNRTKEASTPVDQERKTQATQVILPPTHFVCVKRRYIKPQNHEQPKALQGPTLPLSDKAGTYSFNPPTPLLPKARLLPFLQNALGTLQAGKRIDASKLCRQSAQGRTLRKIPHVTQRRWPQRLQIIVSPSLDNEPHWQDFASIVSSFKALLGSTAVASLRLCEEAFYKNQYRYQQWPVPDKSTQSLNLAWRDWKLPHPEVAILLLSDLGMSKVLAQENQNNHETLAWKRFSRLLSRHSGLVLTLSPARMSPQDLIQCKILKPTPLNDYHLLPRHPKVTGFILDKTKAIEYFLAALSYLPVCDVGLLRALRVGLHLGGSELETWVWNHPHIERMALGCQVHTRHRKHYQTLYQRYFQGTPLGQRIWQILQEHHSKAYEGLRNLERLLQYEAEPPRSEDEKSQQADVLDYFQQLAATCAQQTFPDLKSAVKTQCQTIEQLLPDSIWQGQHSELAYQLFAMAHQETLRQQQWPDALPEHFDPARVKWVLDPTVESQLYGLLQNDSTGNCVLAPFQANLKKPANWIAMLSSIGTAPITLQPLNQPSDQTKNNTNGSFSSAHTVKENECFTIPIQQIMRLSSMHEEVDLQALQRPAWASSMGRDEKGLYALLLWRQEILKIPWQIIKTDQQGVEHWSWNWPKPFGEDAYGLYVDWQIKTLTQRFRWIEPGSFMMGSPEAEKGRYSNENQHSVTLSQGFWLADTAVSQALWQAVMENNPSRFKNPDNPVEQVSWHDAQAFLTKLNALDKSVEASLPSEAQWEYGCRAGSTTPFHFGRELNLQLAHYSGDWENYNIEGSTCPIKQFPPNVWGLYQMHGNVWEWCNDWYSHSYQEPVDPTGPKEPDLLEKDKYQGEACRVLRGGSWCYAGRYLRSASRLRDRPGYRDGGVGFRVALGQATSLGGGAGNRERQPLAEQRQADPASKTTLLQKIKNIFKGES